MRAGCVPSIILALFIVLVLFFIVFSTFRGSGINAGYSQSCRFMCVGLTFVPINFWYVLGALRLVKSSRMFLKH